MAARVLSYSVLFADLDISDVRNRDSFHLAGNSYEIILKGASQVSQLAINSSVSFIAGQDNLVL